MNVLLRVTTQDVAHFFREVRLRRRRVIERETDRAVQMREKSKRVKPVVLKEEAEPISMSLRGVLKSLLDETTDLVAQGRRRKRGEDVHLLGRGLSGREDICRPRFVKETDAVHEKRDHKAAQSALVLEK